MWSMATKLCSIIKCTIHQHWNTCFFKSHYNNLMLLSYLNCWYWYPSHGTLGLLNVVACYRCLIVVNHASLCHYMWSLAFHRWTSDLYNPISCIIDIFLCECQITWIPHEYRHQTVSYAILLFVLQQKETNALKV